VVLEQVFADQFGVLYMYLSKNSPSCLTSFLVMHSKRIRKLRLQNM